MGYNGPKLLYNNKPFIKLLIKPGGGFKKVTYIDAIDGDTAYFLIDGKKEKVRFLVIDTPELRPVMMPYSLSAKDYTNYILSNAKEVYLQTDENGDLFDDTPSERLLAWVWVDGELLNYNLVELGYATVKYVSSDNLMYLKELYKAEKIASQNDIRIHEGNEV